MTELTDRLECLPSYLNEHAVQLDARDLVATAKQVRDWSTAVDEAAAELDRLRDALAWFRDGARPLPIERDELGRMVREAWVRWAEQQTNSKPSWLVPYEELDDEDKEADQQIGEAIARWTLVASACEKLPEFENKGQGDAGC